MAYSEKKKAAIREKMMKYARIAFARQGLHKTSFQEITAAVKIAKSTFYQFFESKEALFFELLKTDAPVLEAKIQRELESAPSVRNGIARLLGTILAELAENPLTRRMLEHPDELQAIAARASPQLRKAGNDGGLSLIIPYLEAGQRKGEVIDGNPELYARAISAITLLALHKDTIGEDKFKPVLEIIVQLLAKALTIQE